MTNYRLNGISFADLPHISKGESVYVIREDGEIWDSEARPAYSVRLNGLHVGYIPLVETIKEEALKARDGYRKVWKSQYEGLTKDELRAVAAMLNKKGEMPNMHDWKFVGKKEMRKTAANKMLECEFVEEVRDWLYTEIMRNDLIPQGVIFPVYYDEKEGRNTVEIGDICSLSIGLDLESCSSNPLGTQTGASELAFRAAHNDTKGE